MPRTRLKRGGDVRKCILTGEKQGLFRKGIHCGAVSRIRGPDLVVFVVVVAVVVVFVVVVA